jgi:antitoxin HicB
MMGKDTAQGIGSSFDEFLAAEGMLAASRAEATKRVIAWQIRQLLTDKGISKTQLARDLNASRQTVDRLLDPDDTGLNLKTLANVADLLGKRLEVRLV